MVPGEPLGNGALYQLATTRSMEGNHFASPPRPRRRQGREGLDDQQHQAEGAQAVLTQEKVLITLPQYRAYHEQYDKRTSLRSLAPSVVSRQRITGWEAQERS